MRVQHLQTTRRRTGAMLAAIGVIAFAAISLGSAHAQGAGPFGVGAPEVGGATSSSGILGWIAAEQSEFYKQLTMALKAIRNDPNAALLLSGLSFAYGVFHAAGPGHGKAVISSYLIANGQTLRRGIVLSFISAFIQGLVAVVFVTVARFIFDVTAVEMTSATEGLELVSALMVTSLGLWMVATKVFGFGKPAPAAYVEDPGHQHDDTCTHALFGDRGPSAGRSGATPAAIVCTDCSQTHMPDPRMLTGRLDWRKAAGAVSAAGIRPCSGAIIILVFAFSQRLYLAGLLSVAAMSLGTGITVSMLATLAVFMKDRAVAFAGAGSRMGGVLVRSAEMLAAFAVLGLGTLLLAATVFGVAMGG